MGDRNNFHPSTGSTPGTQLSSAPMPFPPSAIGGFAGWYHASSHSITYFSPYNAPTSLSTQSTSFVSPDCSSHAATGLLEASTDSGGQVVQNNTLSSPSSALSPSTTGNMSPTTPVEGSSSQSESPASGKAKRRRCWSPEPDYSEQIRERNKKRKRAGQVCDRCRIRRFACDPNPKGCANCSEAGLECKVTDSVTGETIVRGAAGRMMAEIETLKARVTALETENAQLRAIHFSS